MKKWPYFALGLLLTLSQFVFVFFEQAHFDSDQAISGIMAKHLSELRHFPVYTYGAKYVLGLETWLSAPWMAIFGASVATLKLPLLLMNLLSLILIIFLLKKETLISNFKLFLAASFFAIPTPIAASRIVHAAIGVPTSFLGSLLVWVFWKNPIALGILLGVVVPVRPFVFYAVASLLLIDWMKKEHQKPEYKNRWKKTLITFLPILVFFKIIGSLAPNFKGPGVPAMVIKDPIHFFESFQWLMSRNLPVIFGLKKEILADYNIASSLTSGHDLLIFFYAIFVFILAMVFLRWIPKINFKNFKELLIQHSFCTFLMGIGFLSAFVYTEFTRGAESIMLIRYSIMSVFFPIGFLGMYFSKEQNRSFVFPVSGVVIALMVLNMSDHFQLINEYRVNEPMNPYRELVKHLDEQGIKYGKAPFWTAAHVTFFSKEKILLTESDFPRIDEYVNQIQSHADLAVSITDGACADESSSHSFLRWCIGTVLHR